MSPREAQEGYGGSILILLPPELLEIVVGLCDIPTLQSLAETDTKCRNLIKYICIKQLHDATEGGRIPPYTLENGAGIVMPRRAIAGNIDYELFNSDGTLRHIFDRMPCCIKMGIIEIAEKLSRDRQHRIIARQILAAGQAAVVIPPVGGEVQTYYSISIKILINIFAMFIKGQGQGQVDNVQALVPALLQGDLTMEGQQAQGQAAPPVPDQLTQLNAEAEDARSAEAGADAGADADADADADPLVGEVDTVIKRVVDACKDESMEGGGMRGGGNSLDVLIEEASKKEGSDDNFLNLLKENLNEVLNKIPPVSPKLSIHIKTKIGLEVFKELKKKINIRAEE